MFITAETLLPDVLRATPSCRPVLDRNGLAGCGGRHGPHETLGFAGGIILGLSQSFLPFIYGFREVPVRVSDAIFWLWNGAVAVGIGGAVEQPRSGVLADQHRLRHAGELPGLDGPVGRDRTLGLGGVDIGFGAHAPEQVPGPERETGELAWRARSGRRKSPAKRRD